jgi:Concanavalin A-like lectin/glucanases superfamily
VKRILALIPLLFMPTITFAQLTIPTTFCNAGLVPDGYVDFSAMPTAPNFPGPFSVSAPITVTLPVTGVAGLTLQVTIPALQSSSNAGPVYTVNGGTLTLLGSPMSTNAPVLLGLQFSSPVTGVGLVAQSAGRGTNFSLQSDDSTETEHAFQNTVGNSTEPPNFFAIPLQQVGLNSGFTTTYVITTNGPNGGFGNNGISNLRVQSASAYASALKSVPTQGLQQWLRSESAQSQFAGGVSIWPDQSGTGHDATQTVPANQPFGVQADGNACQKGFEFFGNQFFNFNLPIDGWSQMTVFMVAKSTVDPLSGSWPSEAAAIFWNENASWGNTYVTPYQADVSFRFGTTQVNNQPVYTRPVPVGQDFTITRAVHNGSTDSLYVNGLLALSQGNKNSALNGMTGTGYIGQGVNNTFFNGEISEVLVYNRVLSANEAASVESYLRNKFGTR